ncbi:amino acid ABC transporter permease [Faecalibaculum rodentium]|nr:amino acid ABC transporter permease [Faecalibaculum rodentium]
MLKGAGASLALALGALIFGVMIGVVMAAMKLSKSKVLNVIGSVYVEILRGTPMLLQVLFFYLGVPVLYQMIAGTRLRVDPYVVGLIAMSLNSGAYQTELIRSGIQGVDKGQWEACETLGISYVTMMKEVILPQAFKRIIPPMVSEFITLIKDSSLISCIGAAELLYTAQVLGAKYYNYLDPLIIAGCMYLVMTVTISFIARKIEKRMAVSD